MYTVCLVLLALLVSGCAQHVQVSHKAALTDHNRSDDFKTKVVVHMPPRDEQKPSVESGLLVVGPLNDWKIDCHITLAHAVSDLLAQHYSDVSVAEGYRHGCTDCGLIVRPTVESVNLNKLTMQAEVALRLTFYNAQQQEIFSVSERGKSSVLSGSRLGAGVVGYFVPFFGSMVGSQVVEGTVRKAHDAALVKLAQTLNHETRNGQLARTWLPANLMDKDDYGKYEFGAEKVARQQGCNMLEDGIKLVEQSHFKERYEAYCWGQKTFEIHCEYGRCHPDVEGRVAASDD